MCFSEGPLWHILSQIFMLWEFLASATCVLLPFHVNIDLNVIAQQSWESVTSCGDWRPKWIKTILQLQFFFACLLLPSASTEWGMPDETDDCVAWDWVVRHRAGSDSFVNNTVIHHRSRSLWALWFEMCLKAPSWFYQHQMHRFHSAVIYDDARLFWGAFTMRVSKLADSL